MMTMLMMMMLQQERDLKKWDLDDIDIIVRWNSCRELAAAAVAACVRDSSSC